MLIVAYLVIVGNNASTEAISTYFGYNRDAAALHDKAQDAYASSKNPNYFEAGTLLIDLIDAKTYKLLSGPTSCGHCCATPPRRFRRFASRKPWIRRSRACALPTDYPPLITDN